MDTWLWTELHELFEHDDGSLPNLFLNFKDRRAVVAAYARLRELGQDITNGGAWIKLLGEAESRQLSSVPNPAQLVIGEQAESFHIVLGGIKIAEEVLPELGVFVDADRLVFVYRMGPEWSPTTLNAFFVLLLDLSRMDTRSSIHMDNAVLPEVEARLQPCWERFKRESKY